MSNNNDVLTAVLSLTERMDTRFDDVDAKLSKFETRVRVVEKDLTKIKTAGGLVSAVAAFIGWDHLKPWLTSLMK